jgi:F0F1-type ATP synthase assembly protein I
VNGAECYSPTEKSVINMILLLLSVSDWLVIMIGPGGLLLVVPHMLFVVPVFEFYGWECQKV